MSDRPLPGARRFESFVRRTTYTAVTLPVVSLLGSVLAARGEVGAGAAALVAAFALALALSAGNVAVVRWTIGTVVGRARRPHAAVLVAWLLVGAAFLAVTGGLALPAMGLTRVASIAAVAASVVPLLGAGRALVLNAAVLVLTVVLVGVSDPPVLVVGALLISSVLWACWSSAWMMRVVFDLQTAHQDRAALALAEERLRIARDLHDVFGRTLATIAVKSSLASELVERGRAERAGEEIAGIRRIADEAGTGIRRVVRGELRTTWDDEVSGARSLLASAGIGCTVSGDPVPDGCAETLGRVVREGVTNVLRHSAATQVTLTTVSGDGEVLLTIINDGLASGAGEPDPDAGTGLDSMAERVGALGGRFTARRDGPRFVIEAAVPSRRGEPT